MIFASLEGALTDPVMWTFAAVLALCGAVLMWIRCQEVDEEKQRRKEVDLAAEKERRRENRDKLRYKTARVLERGQKRQHEHERESQYPARPISDGRNPISAKRLPPHDGAEEP